MTYASVVDRDAIENEMVWGDRDLPVTTYGLLSQTAGKFPSRNAVTYQLMSGPTDKCETFLWSELKDKTTQVANMLRELGVGETDVVAYLLPNTNETVLTYLGGQVAGIVNPINPLLGPEQIAAILRETNAKVLVTLRAFPKTDVSQKAADAVALAPNVHTVLEVDLHRYLTGIKKLIVPLIRPKTTVTHDAKVLNFSAEMNRQSTTLAFEDSTVDRVAAFSILVVRRACPRLHSTSIPELYTTGGSVRDYCSRKKTCKFARFQCSTCLQRLYRLVRRLRQERM